MKSIKLGGSMSASGNGEEQSSPNKPFHLDLGKVDKELSDSRRRIVKLERAVMINSSASVVLAAVCVAISVALFLHGGK